MTELSSKYYKEISVKAYAKLINKSDKTIYKMIKEGLIAAKKKDKAYVIRVDNFMFDRCEDINKSIHTMKELMESFALRLDKMEKSVPKSLLKKTVLKKSVKPLVKSKKKPSLKIGKKIVKKTVAKPLSQNGKSNGKKK